jgi:hypothetical protein
MIVLGRGWLASLLVSGDVSLPLCICTGRESHEEFEVFTHQQLQAMQEHRYGRPPEETFRNRERHRGNSSLHELLVALAAGLAGLGKRDREKARAARPAY